MKRSDEIDAFLNNLDDLRRVVDGDGAAALLAEGADVLFVGTDADEWSNSSDAAKDAFRQELEATGGSTSNLATYAATTTATSAGSTTSRRCGCPTARSCRCN